MGSSSSGNPRRFFMRQSPSGEDSEEKDEIQNKVVKIEPKKRSLENFCERFNNSDGEAEKKKGAFNIPPKKVPLEIFPERFNNIDREGEKQGSAFNIQPKKDLLETFLGRFNNIDREGENQKVAFNFDSKKTPLESDSTIAMTKAKCGTMLPISRPRKLHRRLSLSDSRTSLAKAKCRTIFAEEITDLEKISACLLADALLFARSITDLLRGDLRAIQQKR